MSRHEPANPRERIEAFLAAGPREVSEDGEFLFELTGPSFRLEEAGGKLLLHLWSAERTWVRRVAGILEERPEKLVLGVERFGAAKPGKLTLAAVRRRAGTGRGRDAARRAYSGWLRRLLAREFPEARLERLSTAADLKRSFSALYTRACLREGKRWWGVAGMNAGESAAAADAALAYALIWLGWNRERHPERDWAGLRLFLPAGRTQTTAARLGGLARERLRVELFSTDEEEFVSTRVDEHDLGNLDTHLVPARLVEDIRAAESSAVERLRALAPGEIEEVVPAGRRELSLRWRGLEFARSAGGRVSFGVGARPQALTRDNFEQLEALVKRLRRERAPEGSAKSPYFRQQAERWLEGLALEAPQAIDPRLAPGRLYRQVPALAGGERGVADLLGATREGQLVVIELKASADLNLPFQGLDYWLRVRWHQERGELGRFGYFPGLALKPTPPELLLVAPALQFHPTTEALVGYLAPEVRVTRVGLNEDWRRGLKVVFRRGRM
ncbi:MAG: hypothetical protein A3D93_00350 [Acidobacteria bacterium RIFCSPHIGHO2_12_FULL_67_30]|nr:MAG: hypothetical protein A2620_00295 [Acidobacteria bacterium RIFCSPHIGHO2_01_FULL_67_28]OFV86345.1 MAG: hypothetical protein A3B65_05950 [Acidobacteria bacterium RIFCSPHIGHO2_02_FULL_67_57]OFV87744.1 MAG: hypothetical protein A3D93_00350 [Acidobacteria bacterium RIFCSPHIGHO2_12_FULL_67_30]